jgi:azurin
MRTSIVMTCLAALSLASSTGCSKSGSEDSSGVAHAATALPPSTTPAAPAEIAPAPKQEVPAPTPPKAAQKVDLEIASVANTMTFDKTKLTVPAGAEVHLTFKNNSTMSTLPHNWALVKPGTEAAVAAAGLKFGEKAGYMDVSDHDVLAFTPMAKPGESSDVTFTAPEPGTYPYVCTIPGHYMMMKGTLTVTP